MGNLLQNAFGDIWNGAVALAIRRSVIDGSFARCNRLRCPRLAAGSSPVMPLTAVTPALRHMMQRQMVQLPFGPRAINLCYDHRCNLACASCRRDFMQAGKRTERRLRQIEDRIRIAIGPGLEEMTVSGFGDPFGSPSYRSLLQTMTRGDFPRLHTLRLHTNGLLWDARMWDSMPHARELLKSAEISVDAARASTYALNRRGGDFSRLLNNLAFIRSLNVPLTLSFVVQQNNYTEMAAFVDLAREYGAAVYFSRLVNWGTFSEQEYRLRCVHDTRHPEHGALIGILETLADQAGVDIGNLRPLLPGQEGAG